MSWLSKDKDISNVLVQLAGLFLRLVSEVLLRTLAVADHLLTPEIICKDVQRNLKR
jgi:hypothetical protein